MLKALKKQVQGIIYLLLHPNQLKWIIIREIHFGGRNRSKQQWVEWQKYDANMHISMIRAHTDTLNASELNSARVKIFSDMVSSIGTGLTVLDVGCGDGVLSLPIWKMGNDVASMELPTVATFAKKCMVPQVVAGDAEQLSFATGNFDVVLASEVVEHLWHPESFVDEAYRVLKTDGYLIVETPEGEAGLNYDSHRHFFTVERLEHMVGARFHLCKVKRLEATGRAQTPTIIVMLQKSLEKN